MVPVLCSGTVLGVREVSMSVMINIGSMWEMKNSMWYVRPRNPFRKLS